MVSEDSGEIRNEGDSLSKQCFAHADDEDLAEIRNKLDLWTIQILSKQLLYREDMGFLMIRVPQATLASGP